MTFTTIVILLTTAMCGFLLARAIQRFLIKSTLYILSFFLIFIALVKVELIIINHDRINDLPHELFFYLANAELSVLAYIIMLAIGVGVAVFTAPKTVINT